MPKPSLHALIWSQMHEHYELLSHGQAGPCFREGDEPAFSDWLDKQTSFAFVGRTGRLSVIKEGRPSGSGYWYAYRKQHRRRHKRYLGRTEKVTFARLEEEASRLNTLPLPAPFVLGPPLSENEAPLAHEGETGSWSSAVLEGEQSVGLLSSRLAPPRPSAWFVERPRLQSLLEGVITHPLTLVSASAGSGKTTLLSAWAAARRRQPRQGRPSGVGGKGAERVLTWLSLEALDNEPIRFWTSVIAALGVQRGKRMRPLGEKALALLHSPQSPPLASVLEALLQELLWEKREHILILDDYQVITDPALHESMLFLLDHLPTSFHLVLISRTDPALPLSRFRVRGYLLEIGDQELRFSQQEAASFLVEAMGLPLSEEEVAMLSERTQGWIAGLQLAALSLRKQQEDRSGFLQRFAGSHRHVLDYVQQDILVWVPTHLQDFLLQTSVLTRLSASLCQAVTGESTPEACQQKLEEVERAHLFVVPLDEERQWYRSHDLFREALHARLQASHPSLVPLLHLRAARWYEEAGQMREAITHALAADSSYAASLMEQAAPAFWLGGEAQTVHTWVLSLPDAVLCDHTRLALDAMLYLLNSVQMSTEQMHAKVVARVEQTILRIETLLHRKPGPMLSHTQVEFIERRLRLLRVLIESRTIHMRGDRERLNILCRELEALPPDEEVRWNLIPLSLTFLLTHVLRGEGAILVERLCEERLQMTEAGDHLGTIRVTHMLALAYLKAGQLHLAHQLALEGLALVEQVGGRTWEAGYLYYVLFEVYYAWNRLEEASDALRHLQSFAQNWHQVDLLCAGEQVRVQISLARGDLVTAQQALHQLEALVEQERFTRHATWLACAQVQYWLASRNLARALGWARQTTFSIQASTTCWHDWEMLMLVHVSLAQQQYTRTLEMLSRFRERLDRPGDIDTAAHFLALWVLALHLAGKRAQAVHVAVRLLALTEPQGYVRCYLDLGEPMKQFLLTLLAPAQVQPEPAHRAAPLSHFFIVKLLAAFEQEEKQGNISAITAPLESQTVASATMIEPLTHREREVLHLLASGASNQEIAQSLVIQVSTAKKHVSNLFDKLGVTSRSQLIARVRRDWLS